MVRAFSSLLNRDETGQHWLTTPSERLTIEVEDAAKRLEDAMSSLSIARDSTATVQPPDWYDDSTATS